MVKQSISFDTIPKGLRELDQWVNHKDKHPKNPRSGKNALTNIPSTWGSFDEALAGLKRDEGLGMGFVFNNNGILGIDLDDCRDPQTGEVHPEAMKIIKAVNSFTEVSPSGTGIHIYTRGKIPTGGRKDSKKQKGFLIEIYQTGHFFTVTGNKYEDYDRLNDGSEATNKLYNELFPVEEFTVLKKVEPSDSDLLRIGLERDNKLIELWNGNRPNGNESSDDQALMNKLAYWCGCDRDRMISAFTESQHTAGKDPAHIKKINRRDYLLRTADKAIQLCTSTAAADNRRFQENREQKMKNNAEIIGRVVPMTTKAELINPFTNKKRYTYNDMGNGYLFADNYKSICRYSPEAKGWMIYNGKFWEPDKGDLKTKEKAKELAKFLTSLTWDMKDAAEREAYGANAKRLFSNHARDMMIKEAQTEYPVYLSELDKRIELFNCQNGTLDLKTFEFREHRAEDLLSKISGVSYDPQAVCSRWIRFIDEVMEGDCEKALFLQKALGYSLQGLANEECLFLLNGERTRNGKGTCMATVYKVFGDYGKNAQPEILAAKKNANSANASEDLARLRGARFLNISEPQKNMKLNEALAKTLTGSDTITARFLHQNSFEYKPQFVIFINTNYKPHISDDSIFRSGRIKVIPFNRFFTEDERDKNLKTDLTTQESLSGIFNWMLEGLKLYREEGLKQPQVVIEAVEAYRKESDKLAQFIDENLIGVPGFKEKTAGVYSKYSAWCRDNGLFPESSQNFIQGLKAKGFEIAHNGHIGNFIRDYKLAC